jgi:hypothetical protein
MDPWFANKVNPHLFSRSAQRLASAGLSFVASKQFEALAVCLERYEKDKLLKRGLCERPGGRKRED